jgi:hypothetical protein
MNKRIGIAASVLVGMLLVVLACKKIEQPEMAQLNQECDCAKEVSADFVMEEIFCYQCPVDDPDKFFTVTDTIFSDKNVRFRALESEATYTWYIGNEILTTNSFARYFGNQLAGNQIPISLVVKKKPNNICFPQDDGYDSITKILYVGNNPNDMDTFLIEGTYRMKSPHLPDSFDVVLDVVRGQSTQEPDYILHVYNLDGQGTNETDYNTTALMNYREIGGRGFVGGKFYYGIDKPAIFDFYYQDVHRKYLGRKL